MPTEKKTGRRGPSRQPPRASTRLHVPEEFTAQVERLATDGRGVARRDNGKVVLISHALPGENVRAVTLADHKDYQEAQLLKVASHPNDLRVEPRCPHFTRGCGGCDLQHIDSAAQPALKRQWFLETLRRVGRWPANACEQADRILQVVPADPWTYRQRVRLHLRDGQAGFHSSRSHTLVPACTPPCLIVHGAIGKRLPEIAAAIHRLEASGELEITVDSPSGALALELEAADAQGKPLSTRELLQALGHVSGLWHQASLLQLDHPFLPKFTLHRKGFVQPHRDAVSLYATCLENWAHDFLAHECEGPVTAWDLYAGSGPFSCVVSHAAHRLGRSCTTVAVEGHSAAAETGARNAPPGTTCITQDVRDFLSQKWETTPQVVIADPPRAGMGVEATMALARGIGDHPTLVALVSCSPAAFARDARILIEQGFTLDSLALFDAFGQTCHYEILAAFRNRPKQDSPV